MADGYFPTLVSKDSTVNSQTNPLFHSITDGTDLLLVNTDGSINITDNGGSLTVDGTVTANIGTTGGLALDATLTSGAQKTKIVDSAGTNLASVSAAGAVKVDGSAVTQPVSGTVTVTATDLDIRDLTLSQDAVKVSANTTANSISNPIFVQTTNAIISGETHSYNQGSAIAAAATSNHDYTVVTAFLLKSVEFACSGGMKVEIQTGPIASLVTKAVGFLPLAGDTHTITFDPPVEVPTTGTGTIRVIRTNRNYVAVDVYSTIIGIDA